jgi:hypothetical protein
MSHRRGLISERLHEVREARARYRRLAVLWSMGKDSDEVYHSDGHSAGRLERPRPQRRTPPRPPPAQGGSGGFQPLPVRPRALQGPWTGPAVAAPPPAGRLACCRALACRAPSGLWRMGASYPGRRPGLRDCRTFGAEATPWWAERARAEPWGLRGTCLTASVPLACWRCFCGPDGNLPLWETLHAPATCVLSPPQSPCREV